MLVGVWVILFLFLGLPQYLHKILAVITGVGLIFLGYKLGSEAPANVDQANSPFEEHKSEVITSPSETVSVSSENLNVAEPSPQSDITNPNQPLN